MEEGEEDVPPCLEDPRSSSPSFRLRLDVVASCLEEPRSSSPPFFFTAARKLEVARLEEPKSSALLLLVLRVALLLDEVEEEVVIPCCETRNSSLRLLLLPLVAVCDNNLLKGVLS
jgi:hypothetical protein